MSGKTITRQHLNGRNNNCGRRREVGAAARSVSSLQGRPLRSDPVVDEPENNAVNVVIGWMQRHVDQYLATPPGTAESRAALDVVLSGWRPCV